MYCLLLIVCFTIQCHSNMTKSWFTQLSPPLQYIHHHILQYQRDPNNREFSKYSFRIYVSSSSLLYELQQHSLVWISQEGVDSGIMGQALDIALSFSYKQKRVLVNSIVSVLLSHGSHLPSHITSPLYRFAFEFVF